MKSAKNRITNIYFSVALIVFVAFCSQHIHAKGCDGNPVHASKFISDQHTRETLTFSNIGIEVGDSIILIQHDSICSGEMFFWNGIAFIEDTTICEVFTLPNGCDSTFCLSLAVNPLPNVLIEMDGDLCHQDVVTLSAGQHDSYTWSSGETAPEITVSFSGDYSVTVTNSFGCKSTATTEVFPGLSFDVFVESPSCVGVDNGLINVVTAPGSSPPLQYSIDGGDQFFPDGKFADLPPGDYHLVVEGENDCQEEVFILLEEPDPISLDAGEDRAIALGESVTLQATTSLSNPMVLWFPSDDLDCPDCLTTNAQPTETTQYILEASDGDGCIVFDTVTIFVGELEASVFIPTAFSPNADGLNDYLTVFADPTVTKVVSLKIFDRWGGLVFEKNGFPLNLVVSGWDGLIKGKPAEGGVYVVLVELEKVGGRKSMATGEVHLIR